MRLRFERSQGGGGDDTALNGIIVACSNISTTSEVVVEWGLWGDWSGTAYCPPGAYAVKATFRLEYRGGDDTAGNSVQLGCSDGTVLAPNNGLWGDLLRPAVTAPAAPITRAALTAPAFASPTLTAPALAAAPAFTAALAPGVATNLPADLHPECAQFDAARNVLVSRFDSGEATAWRDVQYGRGRNQTMIFEDVEGTGSALYGNQTLNLTSIAGVMTNELRNWSTAPTAPFTIVVIQALQTDLIDWSANQLIAELSCESAPQTSGFMFGTREAFISGPHSWASSFHTTKPVPVETGWTFNAFVRRKGGDAGAYYYGGFSGGIALREEFTDQLRISVGADGLTVGTSRCLASAKSRTRLGAVLVYNRALSVTDLTRIHEAYASRFGWRRAGGVPMCYTGIDMAGATVQPDILLVNVSTCQAECNKVASCEFSVFFKWSSSGICSLRRNAINGTAGSNAVADSTTTCFSRPNYGNYYCVPKWTIQGTTLATSATMDKSTCLGECDRGATCQFVSVAAGAVDCTTRGDMFNGTHGVTQPRTDLGPAAEVCIKARGYPQAVECGKWTKDGPGETRLQVDCDGDGLLDAVLFDTTGARGVALSSRGCSTADADTRYPNAPESSCPAVFQNLCPKPLGDWCPGGEVIQLDCDGDGSKDLACLLEDDRSSLRVVRSGLGCRLEAADAYCPPLTAPGSCAFPAGSPCNDGHMLSVDCNADGVRDWVCQGPGGQRGVVSSRRGCGATNALSGYPAAPDNICPVLFGVGTPRPAGARPPAPPTPPGSAKLAP
ncbi:hypothetical protein HYH03_012549 [Edaphochlamys debaryana]|uniref:Apple domain-containing protein n=1 Tax=Edaphochlamys debaryana TaxID=47281 RepID=A0A835XPX1_9CHLO|nr:hypothetical protein HYH03_012549 [Edaphochlamys debaryana]|eukprot:KAG2488927.1 hypothetical protein HYH03_012549 [Edaphochlamys debaryana]